MSPFVVRRERMMTIPADVVWQLIEPADALPAWLPLVARCHVTSGHGQGRRQRSEMTGRGGLTIDQEVITYEPGAALGWREIASQRSGCDVPLHEPVTMTVRLETMGPGTRVVIEGRTEARGVWAAVRWRARVAPRLRSAFGKGLDRLSAAGG